MEGITVKRCLSENIDAELTGIIYEAAMDPHLWPDLLEMLTYMLGPQNPTEKYIKFPTCNPEENDRFSRLLPHFYRALEINRRFNDSNQEHQFTNSLIDQIPIGIIVVNARRQIVSSNKRAYEIIHDKLGLGIIDGKFYINDKKHDQILNQYIVNLTNKNNEIYKNTTYSIAINQQDQIGLSLLISADTYCNNHYDDNAERRVSIFIASPYNQHSISLDVLQSLFQLTPAEARLTALLANAISIDESAKTNHVSIHTARTQLKSIFQKTNTHKQTELVKLVLSSPAVLTTSKKLLNNNIHYTGVEPKTILLNENKIILTDGRQLSFCEYGDAKGLPLFFFHGILGSRYERHPNDRVIQKLGIRLIVPDRPGYGLSDANLNGSYLEFANDMKQLANYLNIPKFSVLGLSVGAIYAAACAYKLPHQVSHATLVSITLPLLSFSDISDLLPSYKLQYAFTRYLPSTAKLFPEFTIKNACANPDKFFKNMPLNPVDREIFFREDLHNHIVQSLLTGSKEYHIGFVDDIMTSVKPWPFRIEDIKTKIDLWHGCEDLHSPISRVRKLIEQSPKARFFPVDNGGHFFIYEHWDEIMKTIICNTKFITNIMPGKNSETREPIIEN